MNPSRPTTARANHAGLLHATDYMAYAYLQHGRDTDAKRVVEHILTLVRVCDGWNRERARASEGVSCEELRFPGATSPVAAQRLEERGLPHDLTVKV